MIAGIINKKQTFYKRILKFLFFHKTLSCAEISCFIERSIPLTTQYLSELVDLGWVVEKGFAISTGGRRPQTYCIKPGVFYIISVAMDQLVTRIALISSDNTINGSIESYKLKLHEDPNCLQKLIDILRIFIKNSKVPISKIVGVGIGMPGFVDAERGINHTFLSTDSDPIVSKIGDALRIPVLIDNDSSLIALAELKWGWGQKRKNVMVINIGWGGGLGIIINGLLFRGHEGFAGELSHIPLFDNNKICSCGKQGCLETETSLLVVAEKAINGLKRRKKPSLVGGLSTDNIDHAAKTIIDAASKGDKYAIELFSEAGYNIGRGASILIHLLNPELIVISGIGSAAGKVWIAPIQQAINEHCIPKISENCDVKISVLGYEAELIGAAALVTSNFEKLPTLIGR
jgi:predicted NBD/HSP70 family sugar kinase